MTKSEQHLAINAAMLACAVIGVYIAFKGIKGAANSAGQAVGGAAVGVVTGVISGVGSAVNDGVNSAVQAATGKSNETLGGWLYDITQPWYQKSFSI